MLLDEFKNEIPTGDCDPDNIFVSATHAERNQCVKEENLSKVWRIDIEQAKDTLITTPQKSVRNNNPKLSRNYGMNDLMLR